MTRVARRILLAHTRTVLSLIHLHCARGLERTLLSSAKRENLIFVLTFEFDLGLGFILTFEFEASLSASPLNSKLHR